MTKIVYENLPKFLASLGIMLIALPFIATLFFLQENAVLLITEDDILELTETARQTIIAKQRIFHFIADNIIVLSGSCILLGCALFYLGYKKWCVLQRKIDDKRDVELQISQMELQNMSNNEKKEKADCEIMKQVQSNIEDVDEEKEGQTLSVEEIKEKQENVKNENRIIRDQISKRYFLVERAVTNVIINLFSNDYTVLSNMKLGPIQYDIIAKKINDANDYIFELKYLFSSDSWNISAWNENLKKVYMQQATYNRETKRNATAVLLIVTLEDQIDNLRKTVETQCAFYSKCIKTCVLTENEIDHLTKAKLLGS